MTLINDRNRDKELGMWISEKVDVEYLDGNPCFGTEKDGELIGAVMFNSWNGSNVCIHNRIDHPAAITRQLLHAVFSFAFKTLGARRITGAVIGNNYKAVALNLRLGFELEGVFKNYLPGERGDIVHFVMWPSTCRYLGEDYGSR